MLHGSGNGMRRGNDEKSIGREKKTKKTNTKPYSRANKNGVSGTPQEVALRIAPSKSDLAKCERAFYDTMGRAWYDAEVNAHGSWAQSVANTIRTEHKTNKMYWVALPSRHKAPLNNGDLVCATDSSILLDVQRVAFPHGRGGRSTGYAICSLPRSRLRYSDVTSSPSPSPSPSSSSSSSSSPSPSVSSASSSSNRILLPTVLYSSSSSSSSSLSSSFSSSA
jgi:hypothetical protein